MIEELRNNMEEAGLRREGRENFETCASDDLLVLMNRKANPVPGAPRDHNENP